MERGTEEIKRLVPIAKKYQELKRARQYLGDALTEKDAQKRSELVAKARALLGYDSEAHKQAVLKSARYLLECAARQQEDEKTTVATRAD